MITFQRHGTRAKAFVRNSYRCFCRHGMRITTCVKATRGMPSAAIVFLWKTPRAADTRYLCSVHPSSPSRVHKTTTYYYMFTFSW
eukprot:m.868297 g.868297  ORF g.868297 m.868297 type:complete len:85 (-) comp23560_c0_seq5:570-824(-)